MVITCRARRRSLGTIFLSWEWTELSRTIPLFQKKNEGIEHILNNIGIISKWIVGRKLLENNVKNQESGLLVVITQNTFLHLWRRITQNYVLIMYMKGNLVLCNKDIVTRNYVIQNQSVISKVHINSQKLI